jgi:RNA binding exosome subunit
LAVEEKKFLQLDKQMRGRNVIHETNGERAIKVKIKVQDWDWIELMEEEGFDDSLGFNKISEL